MKKMNLNYTFISERKKKYILEIKYNLGKPKTKSTSSVCKALYIFIYMFGLHLANSSLEQTVDMKSLIKKHTSYFKCTFIYMALYTSEGFSYLGSPL